MPGSPLHPGSVQPRVIAAAGRGHARRLRGPALPASAAAAAAAWPADVPLAALISGESDHTAAGAWSRWSILARPAMTETTRSFERVLQLLEPPDSTVAEARDGPPFLGGWLLSLDFETTFGAEPLALGDLDADSGRPGRGVCVLQYCPAAYVHDAATGAWWAVGADGAVAALPPLERPSPAPEPAPPLSIEGLESSTGRTAFIASVRAVLERIAAGDVYQVNLAHMLAGRFSGSARALFLAGLAAARPWYGAYLETPSRAIVSASPELFLTVEPGPDGARRVRTRPMKGTRPSARAAELDASAKDRAELTMIVDLLRNDLGRVAVPGSVLVEDARALEPHAGGGLVQAVATVAALVEPRATLADILRATLPPGSVTGAPKIAAARVLAALEPRCRGAYCGVIGFVDAAGRAGLSVAIRTAEIEGRLEHGRTGSAATLRYGAGAGIVADSVPEEEWQETLHKAAWLASLASGSTDVHGGIGAC